MLLAAVYVVVLTVPTVLSALRSVQTDGATGVFTATELICVQHPGHRGCSWRGEFRSNDRQIVRPGIYLSGSSERTLRAGQQTAVVDRGSPRQVYPVRGARSWTPVLVLLLGGVVIVLLVLMRRRMPGR